MRRTLHLLVLLLLLALPGHAAAQEATPDASPAASPVAENTDLLAALGFPALEFSTADATTLEAPADIQAGRYHVTFTNDSSVMIDLEFYQLTDGLTVDDLGDAFDILSSGEGPEPPPEFFEIVFNGGVSALPGATSGVVLDLVPGQWVSNLYAYQDTGVENTFTEFEVAGEMPSIAEPDGITSVSMVEMAFDLDGELVTGPQVLNLVNNGEQPHHFILTKVPDGVTAEDFLVLFNSFFAEATPGVEPVEPAFNLDETEDVFFSLVLSTSQRNMVQIDLEPGTYAMICFLPDPQGVPHVMQGMIEVVVVE